MIPHSISTTPRHAEGPQYRTTFPPHYVVYVESLHEDKVTGATLAHTWAYSAWGNIVSDMIDAKKLAPITQ
jgi:hypothetical protein